MYRNFSFDKQDFDLLTVSMMNCVIAEAQSSSEAHVHGNTFMENFAARKCASLVILLEKIHSKGAAQMVGCVINLPGQNPALRMEMRNIVTEWKHSTKSSLKSELPNLRFSLQNKDTLYFNQDYDRMKKNKVGKPIKKTPASGASILPEETRKQSVNHPHNAEMS